MGKFTVEKWRADLCERTIERCAEVAFDEIGNLQNARKVRDKILSLKEQDDEKR